MPLHVFPAASEAQHLRWGIPCELLHNNILLTSPHHAEEQEDAADIISTASSSITSLEVIFWTSYNIRAAHTEMAVSGIYFPTHPATWLTGRSWLCSSDCTLGNMTCTHVAVISTLSCWLITYICTGNTCWPRQQQRLLQDTFPEGYSIAVCSMQVGC